MHDIIARADTKRKIQNERYKLRYGKWCFGPYSQPSLPCHTPGIGSRIFQNPPTKIESKKHQSNDVSDVRGFVERTSDETYWQISRPALTYENSLPQSLRDGQGRQQISCKRKCGNSNKKIV